MSDFSESARKIHESTENMLQAVRAEASRLLEQMDDADAKFEEQDNTIASLRETARMQAEEIERISADYQDKIDRRDAELMLGLTGSACGERGICVAALWEIGCVIRGQHMRVAKRGFEADYGPDQDDITYFA